MGPLFGYYCPNLRNDRGSSNGLRVTSSEQQGERDLRIIFRKTLLLNEDIKSILILESEPKTKISSYYSKKKFGA